MKTFGFRTLASRFVREIFNIDKKTLNKIVKEIGVGEKRTTDTWFNSADCDKIADYLNVPRK